MRAVNLIPKDERGRRSGSGGPSLSVSNALAYVVVAGLVLLLGAVTLYATTSSKISDREAEVAELEAEEAAVRTRAEALTAFTSFEARRKARQTTVVSLAESRFDWERVMRELARVIPPDVWLTQLDAVSTAAEGEAPIEGPSIQMVGCAAGHEVVGEMTEALEDIDGVTRVGLSSSELPDPGQSQNAGGGDSEGSSEECRTRDFISRFDITVAFDKVETVGATTVPGVPEGALPPPPPPGQSAPTEGQQQAASDGGVSAGVVR